jgi:hypothetical protein
MVLDLNFMLISANADDVSTGVVSDLRCAPLDGGRYCMEGRTFKLAFSLVF